MSGKPHNHQEGLSRPPVTPHPAGLTASRARDVQRTAPGISPISVVPRTTHAPGTPFVPQTQESRRTLSDVGQLQTLSRSTGVSRMSGTSEMRVTRRRLPDIAPAQALQRTPISRAPDASQILDVPRTPEGQQTPERPETPNAPRRERQSTFHRFYNEAEREGSLTLAAATRAVARGSSTKASRQTRAAPVAKLLHRIQPPNKFVARVDNIASEPRSSADTATSWITHNSRRVYEYQMTSRKVKDMNLETGNIAHAQDVLTKPRERRVSCACFTRLVCATSLCIALTIVAWVILFSMVIIGHCAGKQSNQRKDTGVWVMRQLHV
ncbi:hypothetical protein K458DRAFT_405999 [Lentithecium fluviatile CBS 122367]|uniref:Uncharacterized protein n=1 Tax=Lentithecium fluviatile CBS 122367 TaxID=1168545 RepID=A0A6G1IWA5_9PLEO|nr:hypothetical protein K458DRAFT_405999 [Lentithecium fluviatile CBS 122367]